MTCGSWLWSLLRPVEFGAGGSVQDPNHRDGTIEDPAHDGAERRTACPPSVAAGTLLPRWAILPTCLRLTSRFSGTDVKQS
jgi:hypothetical protein